MPLLLTASVPHGCWGTYTFPAHIELKAGKAMLSWETTLTAGSGAIGDWLVLGPVPPGEKDAPSTEKQPWDFSSGQTTIDTYLSSFATTRPDQWDFSKPVKFGAKELRWQQVTSSAPLQLSNYTPVTSIVKNEIVRAYALCELEVDTDLWVEVFATTSQSWESRVELQFYLDGEELKDLRQGRETWSPKKLSIKLVKGRHIFLVSTRNENAAADITLKVRELGVPSGGHIKPVLQAVSK